MKKLGLVLALIMPFAGCVTVDHSEVIRTEANGLASGEYRDVRQGTISRVDIGGFGMGITGAPAGGGGMLGARIYPPPTQGNPLPFAKSIAMLNYSSKLQKIKYDDSGDIIEYQFNDTPLRKPNYQPFRQ